MLQMNERIKKYRIKMGLSQGQLSELCGWQDAGRISNYERNVRTPNKQAIAIMAKLFDLKPAQLQYGHGLEDEEEGNKIPPGSAPIIAWNQVIMWKQNELEISEKTEFSKIPGVSPSLNAYESSRIYALKVESDTMISKGLSFNPGSIIFVDPDAKREVGSFIIGAYEDTNEGFFRLIVKEGGKLKLKALNTYYPPEEMTEKFIFCGRVIAHVDILG